MMARTTTRIDVTEKDLVDIFERLRNGTATPEDLETLEDVAGSYVHLTKLIKAGNVSMRELRRLFGYRSSEKLKKLPKKPPKDPPEQGSGGAPSTGTGAEGDGSEAKPDGEAAANPADGKKQAGKGHGRLGADAYTAKHIPVPHGTLNHRDPCPNPHCTGKVYQLKQPKRLVRIVGQEPFTAYVYALAQLRCNLCGDVFTAEPPPGVGEEKYDSSVVAILAVMKYGTGLPMYRLEKLQQMMGVPFPDATQWDVLESASHPLFPAFKELVRQAAQLDTFHNDDTYMCTLSLLKENEKLDPKKDRTGMFTTGIVATSAERRIAIYMTGRQHAGENLRDVLVQRAAELAPPMQMCDGLDRNLPGELETILGNCLSHARRYFVDQHANFPEECRHVLQELGKVYRNDATAKKEGLDPVQRFQLHMERSEPVMTGLKGWLEDKLHRLEVEPNSGLGRAFNYMLKRWEALTLFLRKAGAPLDNNIVERSLKRAILHRKNALFYRTQKGASIGDLFMSFIHTCELNKVDPRRYLQALLEHRDQVASNPADWMPWNYHAALADLG